MNRVLSGQNLGKNYLTIVIRVMGEDMVNVHVPSRKVFTNKVFMV